MVMLCGASGVGAYQEAVGSMKAGKEVAAPTANKSVSTVTAVGIEG